MNPRHDCGPPHQHEIIDERWSAECDANFERPDLASVHYPLSPKINKGPGEVGLNVILHPYDLTKFPAQVINLKYEQ